MVAIYYTGGTIWVMYVLDMIDIDILDSHLNDGTDSI